jgi:signal transduction histidine kinase
MDVTARSQRLRPVADGLSGVPRWPLIALIVLGSAGLVWLVAPSSVGEPVASVAIFFGAIVAGITFIRRSRLLAGRERQAWALVGWGFTVGSFGMVALGMTTIVRGGAPAFGPADAIFIMGYLGVLVGFASLPHTAGTRLLRARIGLDGLIGAVAVSALLWVFVLEAVAVSSNAVPVWEGLVGFAYPLVDLAALVVFMIVTVRQSSFRFDLRIILLATGIVAQAAADIQFFVNGVGRSLSEAQPPQLLYLFAIGCYVSTAAIVDRVPPAREYADRHAPLWALVAPYGAAIAMVVVLGTRLADASLGRTDQVLIAATFVVAGLVIGRQALAIRENRIVVEQQRSDLVSSISHELRTPLTAMVGFLEIVKEDSSLSKTERIEMIDIVAEQATYLERIVEDLLALAHGAPDRMDLELDERNLAAIIENAVLATAVNRRRIDVEVEPGLTAVVDGNRMQQVLVNLLSNAARYGGDRCLVAAYAEGSGLVIEVHDSGPGVPKKHEIAIWERFERGQNRYNAAVPGSGIGLAMVKSIAESHGGRASYRRSDRLGGACFSIDLPGRVGKQRPIAIVPGHKTAIG